MEEIQIQKEILERIIAATDAQVNDYEWMKHCIMEYGIYPYKNTELLFPDARFTQNGIMQVPSEFAAFCNYISNFYIETAIELGVYRGRSSYIICALLYRKNKNLKYNMVDLVDHLDGFDVFSSILPCTKLVPSTSDDYKGKPFDFVFIDADHSYDASLQDYINVGQYATKLVCFHDIYGHEYSRFNGGIVRTWNEVSRLSKQYVKLTFSQFENQWMGIGLCVKNEMPQAPFEAFRHILETVNAQMDAFQNFFDTNKKLYFYGAGVYAQTFYTFAKKSNKQIEAFLILEGGKKTASIDGLPVFSVNQITDAHDECRILLALPEHLHKNVLNSLMKKGFQDVRCCSDLLFNYLMGL